MTLIRSRYFPHELLEIKMKEKVEEGGASLQVPADKQVLLMLTAKDDRRSAFTNTSVEEFQKTT